MHRDNPVLLSNYQLSGDNDAYANARLTVGYSRSAIWTNMIT